MKPLTPLRLFLILLAFAPPLRLWSASPAETTRAAFLQVIDRPRVPLAPDIRPVAEKDGLAQFAFSYATEAGQRVPGILVKPAAPAAARRAVVISLHGTGGDKEGQLKLLNQFAAAGFIAVAIDTRYHGARASARKDNADYTDAILRAYRTRHERPFFYDTVWDVSRLIDWLATRDDVDPARIGLIGFSKGGIETYLTAAADPRIAAAVSCIGVQSFRWALEHDAWPSRVGTVQAAFDAAAQDAGIAKPTADFARKFYDRVAPGLAGQFDGPAMLPLIAPRPFLAINGDTDPLTPLPGIEECATAARTAYAAAGARENFLLLVQPKTGHKVTPESLQAARDWLARWLKP
jgi:dienelactone hydrolase